MCGPASDVIAAVCDVVSSVPSSSQRTKKFEPPGSGAVTATAAPGAYFSVAGVAGAETPNASVVAARVTGPPPAPVASSVSVTGFM